jgi:hypothetical protein
MGGPIFSRSVQGVDDNSPSRGFGVRGVSNTGGFGVIGLKDTTGRDEVERAGVAGHSNTGPGLYGSSGSGLAALLEGDVTITGGVDMTGPVSITGPLTKPGGSFKIDHPLDPANKYLSHSFVESPDMKNVYDGVVVLDDKGEAEIELPDWFGALNKDFRYQLTAIGAPGPNLYISEEISDGVATTTNYSRTSSNKNNNSSRFKIAGGTSGMKVSWQVTGIRKERGYYYTYPELFMVSQKRKG